MTRSGTDHALTEALDVQPTEVQTFLRDSVFLEPLTASLCDEVLCRTDSDEVIDQLVAQKWLEPIAGEPGWYRHHALLRETLRGVVRDQEPEVGSELHRLTARWHERQGDAKRALAHHLAAGDYTAAAELILGHIAARPPSDLPSFLAAVEGDASKTLSRREREVLELLTAGLSNKTIARQLHVSEGTVKSHCYNMFRKLEAGNRTTAVAQARRLGLIR